MLSAKKKSVQKIYGLTRGLAVGSVWARGISGKAVGSIPVVGIPFKVAFAKAMTWRLGA